MISTTIPLTLKLATAFGIYMMAGGIAMYRLGDQVNALIEEFEKSQALTYIAGIMTFTLGTAIILTHNIWTDALAGFVSLIGWVAAIEGLILIAWPEPLWRLSRFLLKPSIVAVAKFSTLALGALLTLLGLTGTAG